MRLGQIIVLSSWMRSVRSSMNSKSYQTSHQRESAIVAPQGSWTVV